MEQLTNKRKVRSFLGIVLALAMVFTSGSSLQVLASTVSTDQIVKELVSGTEVTGQNGEETISSSEVSENTVSEDTLSEDSVSGDYDISLTVSTNQYNSLKVSWAEHLFNVEKYGIYRRVSSLDGEWKCVKRVKATANSSFINSGLQYDTAYQYRVEAWNAAGNVLGTSDVVGATTKIGSVNQDKMKAVLTNKNILNVTWGGVSGAKYYKVERRNADGSWELLTADNFRAKKYPDKVDDPNAPKAENYIYRVSAGRAKDKYSEVLFGEPTMVLCQPTILQLGTVGNKETMGVQFTQSKGATSYVVQRSLKNKSAYRTLPTVTGTTATTPVKYVGTVITSLNGKAIDSIYMKDNGMGADGSYVQLAHGSYYFYKVCAQAVVDGQTLKSKYSADVKVRDTMDAPDLARIDLVDGSHIRMYWEDQEVIKTTYGDYYEIWRSTKPLTGYKRLKTVKLDDKNLSHVTGAKAGVSYNCVSYNLAEVPAEVTYYYKVVSVHLKVRGAQSDYISARTLLDDLTDLTVESSNYNAMTVKFPKVEGATKYNIYMAKDIRDANGNIIPYDRMQFKKVATCTTKPDELTGWITYTKTGLTHGTYYAFKVRPATKYGEHEPVGDELYGYDYTRIKAPKLTATSQAFSKKTIDVKWNAVGGASKYLLEVATNQDFIGATPYEILKGDTEFTSKKKSFTNLIVGTKYYYRITAYKTDKNLDGGELKGSPSKTVCEWVRPGMPQDIKSIGYAGGKGAKLTWTKITDTSTSPYKLQCYQIQRSMGVDADKDGDYEDWTNIAQTASDVYTYKDTEDIANGKLVHYRVFGVYRRTDGTGENLDGRYANVDFCNPKAITLNSTKITLEEGETKTLKVSKFDPTYTTSKKIMWSSDDTNYVSLTTKDESSVTIKGVKITKKNTPIEITAISTSGAYATCLVTVVEKKVENVGNGKVIVLDPGHGGEDPGCDSGGLVEKNITLKVSTYTKSYLEDAGFTVYMTRTGDTTIKLRETRVKMYADKHPNLLVSQHVNSASGASGTECWYSITGLGKEVATKMSSYTASAMGVTNRGAKTKESSDNPGKDYYGINLYAAELGFPGIIMENGFIQNDGSKMDSDDDLKVIAKANANAIIDYFR